jgi:DNA polymerase lambda
MYQRLRQILQNGHLERLDALRSKPGIDVRLAFSRIWGVGPKTAHSLYKRGYRSIEDLRSRGQGELEHRQRVGLARYEDLLQRIPRAEVRQIEAQVADAACAAVPDVEVTTCGSYRRNKPTCGDVDILLCPRGREVDCAGLLKMVVKALQKSGFLTDRLHLELEDRHGGLQEKRGGKRNSYMGVCKLPGKNRLYRRIDIKAYPR